MFRSFVAVAAIAIGMGALIATASAKDAANGTHTGVVVSVSANQLVMSDAKGKNKHTHAITADTKIKLDGKTAMITDLKAGERVSVTIKNNKVTVVSASSPRKKR